MKLDPKVCPHLFFDSGLNIVRIIDEKDQLNTNAVPLYRIMEISVQCRECGLPFAVDWEAIADPDLPPSSTDSRPWTTFDRTMLCVKIHPVKTEQAHAEDGYTPPPKDKLN